MLKRLDTSLPLEERYFSDDGQPHWCVHTVGATKRDVMAALQGAFNSSPSVLRPCEVKEITHDLAYALSYGLKPEFWRRVSSRGPEGKARRSRSLQIPTKHRRELLIVLHRWSVADRLVWITPTEGL